MPNPQASIQHLPWRGHRFPPRVLIFSSFMAFLDGEGPLSSIPAPPYPKHHLVTPALLWQYCPIGPLSLPHHISASTGLGQPCFSLCPSPRTSWPWLVTRAVGFSAKQQRFCGIFSTGCTAAKGTSCRFSLCPSPGGGMGKARFQHNSILSPSNFPLQFHFFFLCWRKSTPSSLQAAAEGSGPSDPHTKRSF